MAFVSSFELGSNFEHAMRMPTAADESEVSQVFSVLIDRQPTRSSGFRLFSKPPVQLVSKLNQPQSAVIPPAPSFYTPLPLTTSLN